MNCTGNWRINALFVWIVDSSGYLVLRIGRMIYRSQETSLFCFHFPLEGKIKLIGCHRSALLYFCSSLRCVLPSCLIFNLRVKPLVLDTLIFFVLSASIPIMLYYIVLSPIPLSYLVNSFSPLAHCHYFCFQAYLPTFFLLPFPGCGFVGHSFPLATKLGQTRPEPWQFSGGIVHEKHTFRMKLSVSSESFVRKLSFYLHCKPANKTLKLGLLPTFWDLCINLFF